MFQKFTIFLWLFIIIDVLIAFNYHEQNIVITKPRELLENCPKVFKNYKYRVRKGYILNSFSLHRYQFY